IEQRRDNTRNHFKKNKSHKYENNKNKEKNKTKAIKIITAAIMLFSTVKVISRNKGRFLTSSPLCFSMALEKSSN
ncbi:MAG TPA: hypothetical protein PKH98_03715, partial [Candidatus Omnitrophota bacterium]|nr:hypothetical protein [Candidatus Omnitrophota bacterium]